MYVLRARYVSTCGGVALRFMRQTQTTRLASPFHPDGGRIHTRCCNDGFRAELVCMCAQTCCYACGFLLRLHMYLVLSFLHVHMQLLLHWEAGCLLVHMVAHMTKRILSMLARVFLCSRPSLKVYKRVILRPLAKKMRSPPAIANMVCYTLYPVTARRKLLELHNENHSRCSERTPKAKEPKRDSTTENDSRQSCCRAIQTYEDTENI